MHEVRRDRDRLGAAIDEALRRRDERLIRACPILGDLHFPDIGEVRRIKEDPRRMMTAELTSHRLIDLRVVLDARMPTHSTQQTDPAHLPLLVITKPATPSSLTPSIHAR